MNPRVSRTEPPAALAPDRGFGQSLRMSRALITVRILALVCLALGLMCAGLALAWQDQREQTACWRTAAQFQQVPPDDCGS